MFFYSYDHDLDYDKIKGLLDSGDTTAIKDTDSVYLFDDDENTIGLVRIDENKLEWLALQQQYDNEKILGGIFNFCVKNAKQYDFSNILVNKDILCLSPIIEKYGEPYNERYVQINF